MPDPVKANLLIVDDDLNGLRAMKRLLGGPDRKVVAVSSGQDALRAVLGTEFALIVLDIRMPEMNGFETAALIRKRRQSRHTPIIFLTAAFDDIDSVFRGYQVGAVDYLLKPVDPDILRAKAAVFIELYHKRAELAVEVAQRQRAESELERVNASLEMKIRERTASLLSANEQLKREIESRMRIEEELRAATQAAQAANVAKSTFLANMSHEIRTPMSAIIGMTDVALRTDLTPEQRQYLGLAKAASESLLRVINDILDFSKIEAGKLEIESIPFSLRESLSQSMKTLAVQAHERGLELAYEVAPDVPDALIGDPIRLRQIVSNLAGNAIKFTEQGEVVIRVRSDETADKALAAHFTVTDTGIGISADKQAEIFAPFQQADSSTTRLYGGTGLGLAIAARLVALMNGKIWVESAPGRGSTFHFTVSLDRQSGPELLREGFDFSTVRALVVEDHPVHRQVMVEMLRQWKVDVREAAGGASAREALRRAAADNELLHVVLLDESLPDADSAALATEMLGDGASAPRVIILLASSSTPADAETPSLPERVYRLAKPITQTELLHVLEAGSGTAQGVESEEPPVASRTPMRVLLVEDNVINRRLAQIVLEREGHKVVAVENGAAALEALQKVAFDVVLMDLQMPHMDGLETTIAIRNREKFTGEHVPIIALTAHAMAGDRERCLEAGMDGYLTKPVDPTRLLNAIGRSPPAANAAPLPPRKVVLDRATLIDRVDGDPQLLEEIVELYFGNYGRLMADAKRAMAARNGEGFRDALHTLAGMFQNLGACSAQDLVDMLRRMDLARELERADMIWVMLDQEVQALNAELSSLLYERSATGTDDR